jgi:mRNA interferase MazF
MVINQGDIFWVSLDEPGGAEPGYAHPHVVIQENVQILSDHRPAG